MHIDKPGLHRVAGADLQTACYKLKIVDFVTQIAERICAYATCTVLGNAVNAK